MRETLLLTALGICYFLTRTLWLGTAFAPVFQPQLPETGKIPRNKSQETGEEKISWLNCDLCENNYVFIISSGVVGNDKVVDMLENFPGVEVSDEGNGALNVFHRLPFFPGSINAGWGAFIGGKPRDGAFEHGVVEMKSLFCGVQEYFKLISDFSPDSRIKVFQTSGLFNFTELVVLKRIFPCGMFIMDYGGVSNDLPPDLVAQKKSFGRFSHVTQDRTLRLPFDTFSPNNYYRLLIRWLGYSDCVFNYMALSPKGKSSADEQPLLQGSCVLENFNATIASRRSSRRKTSKRATISRQDIKGGRRQQKPRKKVVIVG